MFRRNVAEQRAEQGFEMSRIERDVTTESWYAVGLSSCTSGLCGPKNLVGEHCLGLAYQQISLQYEHGGTIKYDIRPKLYLLDVNT